MPRPRQSRREPDLPPPAVPGRPAHPPGRLVGDDVRSIDWRGTARRSEVLVRTWRPERDRYILVLLDTVVLLMDLNRAALAENLLPHVALLAARHQPLVGAVADPRVDELACRPPGG